MPNRKSNDEFVTAEQLRELLQNTIPALITHMIKPALDHYAHYINLIGADVEKMDGASAERKAAKLFEQKMQVLAKAIDDAREQYDVQRNFAVLFERAGRQTLKTYDDRIAELQKIVEDIPRDAVTGYGGTWEANKRYTKGTFVTDRGAMFFALENTSSRPGSDDAWVLTAKNHD